MEVQSLSPRHAGLLGTKGFRDLYSRVCDAMDHQTTKTVSAKELFQMQADERIFDVQRAVDELRHQKEILQDLQKRIDKIVSTVTPPEASLARSYKEALQRNEAAGAAITTLEAQLVEIQENKRKTMEEKAAIATQNAAAMEQIDIKVQLFIKALALRIEPVNKSKIRVEYTDLVREAYLEIQEDKSVRISSVELSREALSELERAFPLSGFPPLLSSLRSLLKAKGQNTDQSATLPHASS